MTVSARGTFCVYGEGHLADTLRCDIELSGLGLRSQAPAPLAFVAQDVVDHADLGQLARVRQLFDWATRDHQFVIVLSQVPPGWTRGAARGRAGVFYQVDTIIVRRAVERMRRPEQIIVGCADPAAPLPLAYQAYLAAHDCPVLQMSYESAEMAKCAINYVLARQVEAACELATACGAVGADYPQVERALRNDARIGAQAYLRPGRTNQHLDRDVVTIRRLLREAGHGLSCDG